MKYLLILIVLMGCTDPSTNEYQSRQIDSLKDRMTQTEDALIVKSDSLNLLKEWVADLQQEQTFQFKDIDSTKRAVVWLGAQVIRHDTIIASGKSGLIKSEKRAKNWGIFVRTLLGK